VGVSLGKGKVALKGMALVSPGEERVGLKGSAPFETGARRGCSCSGELAAALRGEAFENPGEEWEGLKGSAPFEWKVALSARAPENGYGTKGLSVLIERWGR